ncbi:MAG: hypothetical protein ACTSRI_12455 [Promethearchaeota archaeon]
MTSLSLYWGFSSKYVGIFKTRLRKNQNRKFPEKNLERLKDILSKKLGAKALVCFHIIKKYKENKISGLQFIDQICLELGRVSGEISLTDKEIGEILGSSKFFIINIKRSLNCPNYKRIYNPDYKFSLERLNLMMRNLKTIFGLRAVKCLELIEKYKNTNPDLKKYSRQQHNVKNAHFFQDIDSVEKAYWLGFMSDGWLERNSYTIGLELSEKDEQQMHDFAKIIGIDEKRIKPKVQFHRYNGKLNKYQKVVLRFGCKPMCQELEEAGLFGSKSERKEVPPPIRALIETARAKKGNQWFNTDEGRTALAWLLGFFDADGQHRYILSANLGSSSEQLLEEIKEIYCIKWKVKTKTEPGDVKFVFNRACITKGFHTITLGTDIFKKMINSYGGGLKRKRPKKPSEEGQLSRKLNI